MQTNQFLDSTKQLKEMDKRDIANLIVESQDDLISFYIKHGHKKTHEETMKKIFSRMEAKKFIKTIKFIIKEDKEALSVGFVALIAGLIEHISRTRRENPDNDRSEIVSAYSDIAATLLEKRLKKLSKDLELKESVILELLFVVPDKEFISEPKFIGHYSQKMLRKLYVLAKDQDTGINSVAKIKEVFKKVLGKKLLDVVAVHILLEKKEYLKNFNDKQQTLWNLMTEFALTTIEEQEKEHINELLIYYAERRAQDNKNNRDGARRIQLSGISEEDYPKLAKRVNKLSKDDKIKKYL